MYSLLHNHLVRKKNKSTILFSCSFLANLSFFFHHSLQLAILTFYYYHSKTFILMLKSNIYITQCLSEVLGDPKQYIRQMYNFQFQIFKKAYKTKMLIKYSCLLPLNIQDVYFILYQLLLIIKYEHLLKVLFLNFL